MPAPHRRPRRRSPMPSPSSGSSSDVIEAEYTVVEATGSPSQPPLDVHAVPRGEPVVGEIPVCCAVCGAEGAKPVGLVGPFSAPICERCERVGRLAVHVFGG